MSGEAQSHSEYISDDDFMMMPVNDLDKDTMQLQIIDADHMSGSLFFNPEQSCTNKSALEAAANPGNINRLSLERPHSTKGS